MYDVQCFPLQQQKKQQQQQQATAIETWNHCPFCINGIIKKRKKNSKWLSWSRSCFCSKKIALVIYDSNIRNKHTQWDTFKVFIFEFLQLSIINIWSILVLQTLIIIFHENKKKINKFFFKQKLNFIFSVGQKKKQENLHYISIDCFHFFFFILHWNDDDDHYCDKSINRSIIYDLSI